VAVLDALDERAVDAHAEALVSQAGSIDVSFNLITRGDVQRIPLIDMTTDDLLRAGGVRRPGHVPHVDLHQDRPAGADRVRLQLRERRRDAPRSRRDGHAYRGPAREVPHVIVFKAAGDNGTEMTVTEYGYTTEQARDFSDRKYDT
jgi:hypothetical protein